jgi:hypothetical protein
LTLDKDLLCLVPENKHSAKYLTLGKDADSGSVAAKHGITMLINASTRHYTTILSP